MKNNLVKVLVCGTILMVTGSVLFADSPIDNVEWVVGPRVGFSYVFINSEDFTEKINEIELYENESYVPFNSQFGFSIEQRIPLGTTKSHFAFQEVVSVGGIDQSIALPSVAVLLGYRSNIGFEFGLGPVWSLEGFSVVYAVGWTFSFHGVYIPVNIVAVPDVSDDHHRVGLYTGFNFHVD